MFCFLWIECVFLLDSMFLDSWFVPISTVYLRLRNSVVKQYITLGELQFIQGRAKKLKGNVAFTDSTDSVTKTVLVYLC